jgi:hypothetical protein
MGNTRSSKHASIDWLAKGPLAPHIDEFMLYLANRDYAANTFCNYLGVVSHFAQWMHGSSATVAKHRRSAGRQVY